MCLLSLSQSVLSPRPIRIASLRAIGNIRPANDQTKAEKDFLFTATRTKAGDDLPPYYLVYFLLVDLLGFPNLGQSEKIAWSIPIDVDGEAFYDRELREARAQRLELEQQLCATTVVVDFQVDAKAIAAAVRKGLAMATPEQHQTLLRGIIRKVRYHAGGVEIEFSVPIAPAGAQYCQQQQLTAGACGGRG